MTNRETTMTRRPVLAAMLAVLGLLAAGSAGAAASVALREVKPGNIWFPTSAIPDKIADELVKLLQAQKVKTVAINMLQLPFSQEIKRFLVPALGKTDIKIVVNEEYAPGVKDMT